jgi:hypothetical protein
MTLLLVSPVFWCWLRVMVLPVSDLELLIQTPALENSNSVKTLNLLLWFLLVLAFGHLSYGDFWGFLLNILFALLGYITFKRLQLSTLAFFSFLCAFNAGIDLMASISLLSSIAASSADQLVELAKTLQIELWQLVAAAVVVSLDAIVFTTCLFLTCRVYSDLRAAVYSQLGLLGQPLIIQRPTTNAPQDALAQGPEHAAFRPFQGRPHRIIPESTA